MLYGFKEYFDNRVTSIITAATTMKEFEEWKETILHGDPIVQWTDYELVDTFQMLFNPIFEGYQYPVLVFYHTDETQQELFFADKGIENAHQWPAKDRHIRMILDFKDQSEELDSFTGIKNEKKTIAELLGIEEEDPWDHRSDEEKKEDEEIKKKINEARKKGEITGDSFAGAAAQKEANKEAAAEEESKAAGKTPEKRGHVRVSDIRASRDADGNIIIDNVIAHKWGGEIDEGIIAANEAEKAKREEEEAEISPEDWATILMGNGASESQKIYQDNPIVQNSDVKSRKKLSESAEAYKERLSSEREEARRLKNAAARKEQEVIERQEHEKDIFKGAQLAGDEMKVSELPEILQEKLKELKIDVEEVLYRKYPLNSQIGKRVFLPFDTPLNTGKGVHIISEINLKIETTITMVGVGVIVAERGEKEGPGWIIYGSSLRSDDTASTETLIDAKTATVADTEKKVTKEDIWIVEVQEE